MRQEWKTPRPGGARGVKGSIESNYSTDSATPASIWWGRQACACRGAGKCLCCLRFDRAIRAHQARVAAAGGY